MPVEDVDANIRRNLVAVSAVVLISTYLDVPIVALAFDRLLNLENPIPPHKLIALGYAFLGYFSLRLAVSEKDGIDASRRRQEVWNARMWAIRTWLIAGANRFIRTGKEPAVMRGKLANGVTADAKKHGINKPYDQVKFEAGQPQDPVQSWVVPFTIYYKWPKPTPASPPHVGGSFPLKLNVPLVHRVRFAFSVWMRRTFYTTEGMQIEFPALLCCAAQIALAYQLVRIA
jgi:hypothetical protein